MTSEGWSPSQPSGKSGPWQDRVAFGPGGGFAYRPGEVLIPTADLRTLTLPNVLAQSKMDEEALGDGAFARFRNVPNTLETIAQLRRAGTAAQVNHVLFATGCCCSRSSSAGCPPHPSTPGAKEFYEANPFYANPFYANPFYANPSGGCGCGSGGAEANPFYANPFYANTEPNTVVPRANASGRRRTSARPADSPEQTNAGDHSGVRVAIVDTGYALNEVGPGGIMTSANINGPKTDIPSDDGDAYYDPAAGHGTFIAGIIEQLAPGCQLQIVDVLSTYGDGDEAEISTALEQLSKQKGEDFVQLVNLSFSAYSPFGMAALAYAVARLQANGTVVVASAGNDATCVPTYPAVLPGVVSVGAIDGDGNAATFTNYGPWVRAAALGVDVVSSFFTWDGAEQAQGGVDPDDFYGGARWSGTSFAAPRVVSELARLVASGKTPQEAVVTLIDDPNQPRMPMLGTIV